MLGVIGGSGFYNLEGLEITKNHDINTAFGKPSAPIAQGTYKGKDVLFLPRHGKNHEFLPSEVNYRANIFALKKLGARRIFAASAVGSLREDIKPGELAITSQYFDHTKGKREYSFFGNGLVAHISTAYPTCASLSEDIINAANKIGQNIHINKTYGCIEGPRLGTRAESFFLRDSAGCDLVGMTNVPEAFLAREAQMAYCCIALVTDYDCWMDDPNEHVNIEKFMEIYGGAVKKAKIILATLLENEFTKTPDDIRKCLHVSMLTAEDKIPDEHKEWLEVLRA